MPSIHHEEYHQSNHRNNENKPVVYKTDASLSNNSKHENPILRYDAIEGRITQYTDYKGSRTTQSKAVNEFQSGKSTKSSSDVSISAMLVSKPNTKESASKKTIHQSRIANGAKNNTCTSPVESPATNERPSAGKDFTPKSFPSNHVPLHATDNCNQTGANHSGQPSSHHTPRKNYNYRRNNTDRSPRHYDKRNRSNQNGNKFFNRSRGHTQKGGQNKSTLNRSSEEHSMLSPGLAKSPTSPVINKEGNSVKNEDGNSVNNEDRNSVLTEIGSISTDLDRVQINNQKEKIRANQGNDPAAEHIDFSGARIPPPCDWESGRPRFDNSFMKSYIEEWREGHKLESGPTGFETNADWQSGDFHVMNYLLVTELEYRSDKLTSGDPGTLDEEPAQQTTGKVANQKTTKNEHKSLAQSKTNQNELQARPIEMNNGVPELSSFSPKIQMYLRPAVIDDSEQIAQIYNKHIAGGNITEDQEPILTDDAMHLIKNNKREKLPFIVAVAGRCPIRFDEQNSRKKKKKISLPKNEKIIGFAFNERFNYGFSGSVNGRSRFTTTLQLFVAHDYQCKGVGRNLLDRLIHMLSTAYGYHKACDFINPEGDEVHECEGSGMWHQIQFHVPVLKQDDPVYPRIKDFLFSNFLIREVCRMKSTGRTNVNRGPAKWLDTVIFQFEISQEGNFGPYS